MKYGKGPVPYTNVEPPEDEGYGRVIESVSATPPAYPGLVTVYVRTDSSVAYTKKS